MTEQENLDTAPSSAEEKEARQLAIQSHEFAKVKARNLEFMDMTRFKNMEMMAQTFVSSGALPSGWNAAKVVVAFQAAYERGMYPVEAINSFAFVNGKISLYGELVIGKVLQQGHEITWGEYIDEAGEVKKMICTDKQASVTIRRGDNGKVLSAHMTREEAHTRKLDWDSKNNCMKGPWVNAPDNMLKFKVFSMVQKFLVPDATMNLPIKEELEADLVIDAEVTPPSGNAIGNKPLSEAIAASDEKIIEVDVTPKEKPPKRTKKEKADEAVAEEAQEVEHDDDKYTRLVQEELSGKALSAEDKKWLNSRSAA